MPSSSLNSYSSRMEVGFAPGMPYKRGNQNYLQTISKQLTSRLHDKRELSSAGPAVEVALVELAAADDNVVKLVFPVPVIPER